MPLHSAATGSEVHQDKLIGVATTADAGKITTPSSVSNGVGELRKLKATELDSQATTADAGKVWTPDATTNGVITLRKLAPADLQAYKTLAHAEFTDIGTATTEYGIAAHSTSSIRIMVVLYGAITAADETVRVTVGTATAVDLTVPTAGSGAGIVTLGTLTTLSAVQAEGSRVTIATLGNSTGPTRAKVVVQTVSA